MTPLAPSEADFGEIIRRRRLQLGYKLRQFAEMVDLSPSYLSLKERGEQPPPGEKTIERITQILELDTDQLLAKAGKVSTELRAIILERPEIMCPFLRLMKNKSTSEIKRIIIAVVKKVER